VRQPDHILTIRRPQLTAPFDNGAAVVACSFGTLVAVEMAAARSQRFAKLRWSLLGGLGRIGTVAVLLAATSLAYWGMPWTGQRGDRMKSGAGLAGPLEADVGGQISRRTPTQKAPAVLVEGETLRAPGVGRPTSVSFQEVQALQAQVSNLEPAAAVVLLTEAVEKLRHPAVLQLLCVAHQRMGSGQVLACLERYVCCHTYVILV